MAEINDWDVSAANNNSAPPNGWPENTMQYSEVNDTGREGMAVLARYFKDMNGSLTTTGAANAYLLTLNAAYAAYFAGMTFTAKFHADNTGATTINVNTIGVKSIVNADGGALNAGQIKNGGVYRLTYDGTNFQIVGAGATGALAQKDTINNDDWFGTDLAVINGGTGAGDPANARANLGLADMATQPASSVAITGGTISGVTITGGTVSGLSSPVAIADGGTGANNVASARSNLGLAIGFNVQAWDTNLDQIAALTPSNSNFIVGNGSAWVVESGATARTSIGLGTGDTVQFSTVTATLFELAGGGAGDTTLQRSRAGEFDCENKPVIMHQSSSMTGGLIRVQSGGSPSGGNNGDIWFIY